MTAGTEHDKLCGSAGDCDADQVIAITCIDDLVAAGGSDHVISAAPRNSVVSDSDEDRIITITTINEVFTVVGDN